MLSESFVDGTSAARILSARPEQLAAVVTPVADWLTRWAVETLADRSPSAELADAWVARPLTALADAVPPRFADVLRSDAEWLSRGTVVTVAAHNDLTMWNIVVAGGGTIGILDWESAGSAFPLTDLFYVLADAVAALTAYGDRRAAFRECFRADGSRADWAHGFVDAAARKLAVDPAAVARSFRLCWLRHAADDALRGRAQGFAAMLRDLADAPNAYWPMSDHAD